MSTPPTVGREPWLAAVLSLVAPGLGHLYGGRLVEGLALFLVSLLFVPLVVLAALQEPSTPVLVGLIAAGVALLGVYGYSAAGAYRTARRQRERYEPREYNRPALYVLFALVGIVYAVGGAWFVPHVFAAFLLPTGSMAPTFLSGDHVLVNKLAYQRRVPRRGDVIVFRVPGKPGFNWIKRVIALPGDTVEVRGTEVLVNGKPLEHDRVPADELTAAGVRVEGDVFVESNAGSRYRILIGGEKSADQPKTTVPAGTCFVLGDHRDRSEDSRAFGPVPLGSILGDVQYVYYPAETWERFGAVRQ
jgi:signal peptidase I